MGSLEEASFQSRFQNRSLNYGGGRVPELGVGAERLKARLPMVDGWREQGGVGVCRRSDRHGGAELQT